MACPGCGYNLRGAAGPYCPECGLVIPMPDLPDTGPPEERLRAYLSNHDVACKHCGYNLRGLQDNACPECGATYQLSLGITYGARHKPEAATRSKHAWRFWWRIHILLVFLALVISTGLAARSAGMFSTPTPAGIWRAMLPAALAIVMTLGWWIAQPFLLDQPPRAIRGVAATGLVFGVLAIILMGLW